MRLPLKFNDIDKIFVLNQIFFNKTKKTLNFNINTINFLNNKILFSMENTLKFNGISLKYFIFNKKCLMEHH